MTLPEGKYSIEEVNWFRNVFDTYYESIRSFAYFKTGDVDLADDIVQETFLNLWDKRQTVRNETVKALLYTIASNTITTHFRHKKVTYKFELAANDYERPEEADAQLRQRELNDALQATIAGLPDKLRVVFLMSRIEGLTYPEIAERLDLSVKAIEKRMSEAIKYIKERFPYKI